MTDLAQTIRDEIQRRKVSAYQLAKDSGVKQPRISVFLAGGGMHSGNLSKLCVYLGLELRRKKP